MAIYKRSGSQGEPSVLFCEREAPPAGARFGPAIRRVYTIECNISGYGTVTVNGKTFPITPGTAMCCCPALR